MRMRASRAPAHGRRRLGRTLTALLLTAAVLEAGFSGSVPGSAVTKSEVDALRSKLNSATSERKKINSELEALRSSASDVEREIRLIDEELDAAEAEVDAQQELLDSLSEVLDAKQLELDGLLADEQAQYDAMRGRVRFMAEHGSTSYLAILLSADDFSDFLYRYEIVKQISLHDEQMFVRLKTTRAAVERQKAELEQTQAEENEVMAMLEDNRRSLEDARDAKARRLQDLRAQVEEAGQELAALAAREDDLMDAYKKAAAELAASDTYVGGDFMWPLPRANNVVTCPYGYRTHPITGVYKLHTGVDLRASTGTKVFATNGGKVTTSTYSSVWGHYIIINHGGGYTSLYAHLSSRRVSVGDKVSQGDVIGYSGNTGWSTGAHLHFEMSKDGATFNPLTLFPNFKVYYA